MDHKEIMEIIKAGGVYALGKKLRPKSGIKRKSLIIWTRNWLKKSKITVPPQVRGRKPVVDYLPK